MAFSLMQFFRFAFFKMYHFQHHTFQEIDERLNLI